MSKDNLRMLIAVREHFEKGENIDFLLKGHNSKENI